MASVEPTIPPEVDPEPFEAGIVETAPPRRLLRLHHTRLDARGRAGWAWKPFETIRVVDLARWKPARTP